MREYEIPMKSNCRLGLELRRSESGLHVYPQNYKLKLNFGKRRRVSAAPPTSPPQTWHYEPAAGSSCVSNARLGVRPYFPKSPPGAHMARLGVKQLFHDAKLNGRASNPGPPEYEASELPLRHLVQYFGINTMRGFLLQGEDFSCKDGVTGRFPCKLPDQWYCPARFPRLKIQKHIPAKTRALVGGKRSSHCVTAAPSTVSGGWFIAVRAAVVWLRLHESAIKALAEKGEGGCASPAQWRQQSWAWPRPELSGERVGRHNENPHAPSKFAIWALAKKLETSGTFLDTNEGGRRKTLQGTIEDVRLQPMASPKMSLRLLALMCQYLAISLRARGGSVVRLLASHLGEPGSIPGGAASSRKWESCWKTPLVGRFSRGSPVSPAFAFQCCSILTLLHLHLFTHCHDL
ncbi:hypothetical protein PR048_005553 [Dryococelus australis]|uniref:Uncharacterized protein n=1 Tax=Dryococelus australis TaxID=614101 RepID=A0ABQ9I932_9NEOP|nr:hypothetical protein PR048_005553 [Dryococelus australis]